MHATTRGYGFALLAVTLFSLQDAISRHLTDDYPPVFITTIRYWAYGLFVLAYLWRRRSGLKAFSCSGHRMVQIIRSVLLAFQVIMTITCFQLVGLAHSQAIFAGAPLVVALLSIIFLKEKVDRSRWLAIGAGLVGVLVMLRPQGDFFDPKILLAVFSTITFAIYGILTRYVSGSDSAETTFVYTGIFGAITLSLIGPFYWTSVHGWGWLFLVTICVTSISSHFCLIKAYSLLDASAVQPLSYLSLVYASGFAVFVFNEPIDWPTVIGAVIVVMAGLFYLMREHAALKRRYKAAIV
jgi:drug/metabolite transporter (DMT)-like permease